MKIWLPPSKICVKRTKKGRTSTRGVFATKKIKSGEVIEICPLIRMSREEVFDEENKNLPTISHYCFEIPKDQGKQLTGIALGYGSLYNHSVTPNAIYYYDSKDAITFEAVAVINKDDEITIQYWPEDDIQPFPSWKFKQ